MAETAGNPGTAAATAATTAATTSAAASPQCPCAAVARASSIAESVGYFESAHLR